MPKPIARWNPARDAWETETTGLFCEHSDVFSETWPTSGTTRAGHGLRAADVGAPHGRFRVFVTAHPADLGHQRRGRARDGWAGSADRCVTAPDTERGRRDGRAHEPLGGPLRRTAAAGAGADVTADAASDGRDEGRPEPARLVGGSDAAQRSAGAAADTDSWGCRIVAHDGAGQPDPQGHDRGDETERRPASQSTSADADRDGPQGVGRVDTLGRDAHGRSGADIAWGIYEPAIRQWERLTRPAPSPTEVGPKGGQRLSPRFTEWMQGWPDGWVTDVPGVSRNDALKICGNGVVPQQAAEAVRRILTTQAAAA